MSKQAAAANGPRSAQSPDRIAEMPTETR
jgi:hypothetical protein